MKQLENVHSLGDVAVISSGVTFRSRIEQATQGTTRLIRLKDITGNDELIRELDFRIHNRFKPHHLLNKGDIIFRPLAPIASNLIYSNIQDTILAAPLLRIRSNRDKILPEYLIWFLNHPGTLARLATLSTMSTVVGVSLRELAKLSITLPDLQTQKLIGDINALAMREQKLLTLITTNRSRYIHGLLARLTEGQGLRETDKQKTNNRKIEVTEP